MDKETYRQVLTQFLDNYWGAFHEVLEAQSVNPQMLAAPLFEALVAEHERFTAPSDGAVDPALQGLGRLWRHVAERREVTLERRSPPERWRMPAHSLSESTTR